MDGIGRWSGSPAGRYRLESATPAESTFAKATLAEVKVARLKDRPYQKAKRVIAEHAYDSDPLRERLAKRGMI